MGIQSDNVAVASPVVEEDAQRSTYGVREVFGILLIAFQLCLILTVIYVFEIESRTFFNIMVLAASGFVANAFLPVRYRLALFTGLSLTSIVIAFGLMDGLSLIALGLILIAICHLTIPIWGRVVLLVSTGALYAMWRLELLPAPWSVTIWPILASMFMFRLALYMYSLKYEPGSSTPMRALAYFFMMPNVCFPLYPVVDYSTFTRNYFDRDEIRIYETGVRWIVRGLIHLLLYRFVYLHLAEDPDNLRSLGDLVQFVLSTFLLYLRVSGSFHIITGILHLYGFRLPETHHLYYLAPSFTDFWRRINIYWKDFMMKLVYYPSFFWLRRKNERFALIGATLIVFFLTWMLHSYQWFWLRGGFPLHIQDGLFWGALGVLVVVGAVREMKRPHRRSLGAGPAWSLSLAVRTVGTFLVICVLWSLWSADSVAGWAMMWFAADNVEPGDLWLIGGLLVGGLLIAGRNWSNRENYDEVERAWYTRPMVTATIPLVALIVLGNPDLYEQFTPKVAETLASLKGSTLNARDEALQHKGYYENLDNVSRMSTQLWHVEAQRPERWVGLSSTEAYIHRRDFALGMLRANTKIEFLDKNLSVNRWAMRDRDYPLEKGPNVYRIVMLGPSHVMGSGVADGETFSDFLERELNANSELAKFAHYEVLNFGLAGCSLFQQLALLEERALKFDPDLVIVTDSPRMANTVVGHVLKVVSRRYAVPYPGLRELIRESGVFALADAGLPVPSQRLRSIFDLLGMQARMPWREAQQRLRLIEDDLVRWGFERIGKTVRESGAVPVFLALDNVVDPPKETMAALEDADAAGLFVFNLLELWKGRDYASLRIAPWDNHPNASGNQLVARKLLELIQKNRSQLGIDKHSLNSSSGTAESSRAKPLATPVMFGQQRK